MLVGCFPLHGIVVKYQGQYRSFVWIHQASLKNYGGFRRAALHSGPTSFSRSRVQPIPVSRVRVKLVVEAESSDTAQLRATGYPVD